MKTGYHRAADCLKKVFDILNTALLIRTKNRGRDAPCFP